MNIILLGAPGAGKGTQAFKIAQKYKLPHVSTGDIFRANIKGGTELGIKAKAFIDKGMLVPDEITVEIVKDRISKEDCKDGFMLDGFPRTLYQAKELAAFCKIDTVININVPLENLMHRLTGRRVCTKCGESFHVDFMEKGQTACTSCGGQLIQRADDNEQSVKTRLDVYVKQTAPLIEYYKEQGVLKDVNGSQPMDEVFLEIVKVLG
ncbi:MAG: adenylate kinase [Clostridia bacterium]|nr:adenylate kinase [Clostridia bacterium]